MQRNAQPLLHLESVVALIPRLDAQLCLPSRFARPAKSERQTAAIPDPAMAQGLNTDRDRRSHFHIFGYSASVVVQLPRIAL
jgi:hypothetical protein